MTCAILQFTYQILRPRVFHQCAGVLRCGLAMHAKPRWVTRIEGNRLRQFVNRAWAGEDARDSMID